MTQEKIFLAYRISTKHEWSKELVYIGTDMGDIIAQLHAHMGLTDNQVKQLKEDTMSYDNDTTYEYDIEEQLTNAFVL